MPCYLQIEAVNINHFVYDTQDLSTIRGGGLLLLEAINQIKAHFSNQGLEAISTGASSGLFYCEMDLKDDIVDFLRQNPQFKHATFMVNTTPVTDDFDRDRETLIALTRWQQLQSATVVYPELSKPTERAVCEIDFVRPVRESKKGEETRLVSESVYQRRQYGLEEKQKFYHREIQQLYALQSDFEQIPPAPLCQRGELPQSPLCQRGELPQSPLYQKEELPQSPLYQKEELPQSPLCQRGELSQSSLYQKEELPQSPLYQRGAGGILKTQTKFVSDFNQLTDDKQRSNLHGKMAVIYLDGNDFGKKQRHICKEGGKEGLKEFDETVKTQRRSFLDKLLDETIGTPTWTNEGAHRLEILLWGGDEMILVVPAWQGWWTLNHFFQCSQNWTVFNPDPKTQERIQLTHAAGLVFCHHNAPIYRITHLAQQLAELAKNKSREENQVAYQVLESFDSTGDELEAFRQRRCPQGVNQADFIIGGKQMNEVLPHIDPIKRALPKGLVYKIVQAQLHQAAEVKPLIENAENMLKAYNYESSFEKLRKCFGTDTTFWIHLIELWDYLEDFNL